MTVVGKVDSLWRYPVKSMCGEQLDEAFVGFSGVYGDRLFAFTNSSSPKGFPWLSGRELAEMLLYRPRFRQPDGAAKPPNLSEAESVAPGATPVYGDQEVFAVEVETPSGKVLAVDDPALVEMLGQHLGGAEQLSLLRSERSMTDCRPVSMFSVQTAQQLGREIGIDLDKRRFRANIYMDLANTDGYAEDTYVGKTLGIGPKAVVSILERDPRCKMVTLDPDTAEENRDVLAKVVQAHNTTAGVYGAVLVEGMVCQGDEIKLLN